MDWRPPKIALAAVVVTLLFGTNVTRAEDALRLPHIFSDNMVLQEGSAARIWGWGPEGAAVTVHFRKETLTARVKDGIWSVNLGSLTPGGPDTLSVTCGKTVNIKNVLVGEVWLASGQSNMEFPLKKSLNSAQDIASSDNSMIHLLHVPETRSDSPANDIDAEWTPCNPKTTPDFSAVAYYFALHLQKALHVPVGIIESSWGGTPIEPWMDRDFLRANPIYRTQVFGAWIVAQDAYERELAKYHKIHAEAEALGQKLTNAPPRQPWKPGELYNGMIAPLTGCAIKGALWYQGESNAGSEQDAWLYHMLLPDLIRNWRSAWGAGEFPFLLVQLAPFRDIKTVPSQSSWASVREAQLQATQSLPNVGMAVITDVGDEHNIHPTQKHPVGMRLALAAGAFAYHQPIEYSGPVLKRVKREANQIVLTFDHAQSGLVSHGSQLVGFSICGPDKKFVWANADIRGLDQVLVYSPLVKHPMAVRFGWADYPVVNLWNKAGFPASPFRTDDFDLR